MKIVILDGFTENPGDLSWDGFKALGELTCYDRTPTDKIVERIGDAEIVIINKCPISAETLSLCPKIKYIGVLATGFNVVDVAAAKERGIVVANIPTYGTQAVAQYTMALLLELCHHVGSHSDAVHAGRWESSADFCFWDYPLVELAGKTLGIIGFGRIGQATAKLALAFGMKILANSPHKKPELETENLRYAELDELFSKSDVISLHCPLIPSTQELINAVSISKMKDGVMILNSSRGPLINEADLTAALDSGKVAGAAVDVVSSEPIRGDNPLLKAKNCLITPHIAWAPKESRVRLMDIAVENLRAFLSGKPQNNVAK